MPYKDRQKNLDCMSRWQKEHRQEINEYLKEWRRQHPENIKNYARKHFEKDPEHCRKMKRDTAKRYAATHPEKVKERLNKWRVKNKEHEKEYRNLPEVKIRAKETRSVWRKENINFQLSSRLRKRLYSAMKANDTTKSKATFELVGCSPWELKQYLESKFYFHPETGEQMTWENRNKWHIDHIIPCASFDLSDSEQQKRCFHYTNLQPLWREYNFKKGAKYNGVDYKSKRQAKQGAITND